MSAMDPRRYEIVPIGIGRDGRWSLQSDALRMLAEATPKKVRTFLAEKYGICSHGSDLAEP